jgi:hypothetical protein
MDCLSCLVLQNLSECKCIRRLESDPSSQDQLHGSDCHARPLITEYSSQLPHDGCTLPATAAYWDSNRGKIIFTNNRMLRSKRCRPLHDHIIIIIISWWWCCRVKAVKCVTHAVRRLKMRTYAGTLELAARRWVWKSWRKVWRHRDHGYISYRHKGLSYNGVTGHSASILTVNSPVNAKLSVITFSVIGCDTLSRCVKHVLLIPKHASRYRILGLGYSAPVSFVAVLTRYPQRSVSTSGDIYRKALYQATV